MIKRTPRKSRFKSPDPSFSVTEGQELMIFLLARMPHKNRDNIKTFLRNRQVLVDENPVTQFNYALQPGQTVTVTRNKIGPAKDYRGISILYEDNDLIVINKHAGILSVATRSKEKFTAYSLLYDHVKTNNPVAKIFVVHRLDRDTSGVMLFAKSAKVQKMLQKSWNDIILERVYVALAEGLVEPPKGQISSYLREDKYMRVISSMEPGSGQWAVTDYSTIRSDENYSLLEMSLRTGRKNQIRVHLQDIGHPIVGDKKYGSSQNPVARMGLHALSIAFLHPVLQKELRFETTIPRKFFLVFK
jgi:23S rRNA pseudouridine1911/1915/1917 synthase